MDTNLTITVFKDIIATSFGRGVTIIEQYFTQNIYVGIRNDHIVCQKENGLFKGKTKTEYSNFDYAGFVETPLGLKCLSNNKVYPVVSEYIDIPEDFACNIEPIIFYMETNKIPLTMTKKEIQTFVMNVYIPEKKEQYYQKIK